MSYSPWTKVTCAKDTYVSEASEMNRAVTCPKCGEDVASADWREEKNAEGEVIMWQHMCSCGTLLKVFND